MPAVKGAQLVRQRQLIGHVVPGMGHVHLAEYRDGRYINPLRLGGLAPYIDDTVPQIPKLTFYSFGNPIAPESVSGFVDVTIDAFDPPPLPALPPEWAQAKLAPAHIRWRIVQGQTIVKPWETAVDFRTFLFPMSLFQHRLRPGHVPEQGQPPGAVRVLPGARARDGTLPQRLVRARGGGARRTGERRPGVVPVHDQERELSL